MFEKQRHRALLQLTASLLVAGTGQLIDPVSAHCEEIQESGHNEIGYPSVAAALAALRARSDVQISQQQGWTIITETDTLVNWSFTPPGNPAHPSAVRRSIVTEGGQTYIKMGVRCESSKEACDKLVRDFNALNSRMAAETKGQPPGPSTLAKSFEGITVTSDSTPGWLPSADQRVQAPLVAQQFLAALDSGDFHKAFGMMTASQQAQEPFEHFSKRLQEFNAQAGAVKTRRIHRVTWTRDSLQAPAPGVYVALDLVSQFENIDRHCGFVMLYQRDAGSAFLVTSQEDDFITNKQAAEVVTQHSAQALEDAWRKIAVYCPKDDASPKTH